MSRFGLKKIHMLNKQSVAENEQELYKMADEVCCSPEFPQGCISTE